MDLLTRAHFCTYNNYIKHEAVNFYLNTRNNNTCIVPMRDGDLTYYIGISYTRI